MNQYTERVIQIIKSIPKGKVMTYGQIATLAGNPRGARQVSRILHSMSTKYDLPWHRVINSQGKISLSGEGYLEQINLLHLEGVELKNDKVDLKEYNWCKTSTQLNK